MRRKWPDFRRKRILARRGIGNGIARSEVTKQASREEIASRCALAITIGLPGEFCAEDVQTFDDGWSCEEFWGVRH